MGGSLDIHTSRESSLYPVIPSSIESKKRFRPYWYLSFSVFITWASTVESMESHL